MRDSACNSTTVIRCNAANLSLTIDVKKKKILINELAQCGFESEVLQKPALHIAKTLCAIQINRTDKWKLKIK